MINLKWAIIYGDRQIFTSDDGSWSDAPPWNAQIVIIPNSTSGREILSRNEHFIMVDNNILNVNNEGLVDHMLNVYEFATLNAIGFPTAFTLVKSGEQVDQIGLLLASVEAGITKVGRYLPTEVFRPLLKDAVALKGLPDKSAWLTHEQRLDL